MNRQQDSTEEWRPVPGYEGLYSVSSLGNIRREGGSPRAPETRPISPVSEPVGYQRVCLSRDCKFYRVRLHRLVALAFLGEPEPGQNVNHKNGVKSDNRVENLEWISHADNCTHAYRTGLREASNKKLTEEQVRHIRRSHLRPIRLAERYGVTITTITDAIKRRTWKYVE